MDKSRYIDATYNITVTKNPDINKFQVGTYVVWGYNTGTSTVLRSHAALWSKRQIQRGKSWFNSAQPRADVLHPIANSTKATIEA
jgi:hypothetical protein